MMTTYERLIEHLEQWEQEIQDSGRSDYGYFPTQAETTAEAIRWLCCELDKVGG